MPVEVPENARDVRVLIADDSLFMRHLLRRALEASPRIAIVGEARDGAEAVQMNGELSPHVIVMDVEMPRVDGLTALRRIMAHKPVPVVMFSSLTGQGTETTLEALSLGAVDFLAKPESRINISPIADELVRKVLAAASARLRQRRRGLPRQQTERREAASGGLSSSLVVIGSSTGGPQALDEVLTQLPRDLPSSVLVVQHMPAGFTRSMAVRLNGLAALPVAEAVEGDTFKRGAILVAPGGMHARVVADKHPCIHLDQSEPVHGVRPSVDVTLMDAGPVFGPKLLVVILTGMGFDGAKGAKMARSLGATVFCQDEATSVVWGMPRACIELGASHKVLPLTKIAGAITRFARDVEEGA
ncbi:MAG: protein-glutamate methylesterase/protein-glutamine glutaminase [Bacillota bacterium]